MNSDTQRSEQWERVQSIFCAAVEMPSAERSAFVEQACAGDGNLRHEVESLLAHDDSDSVISREFEKAAARMVEGESLSGQRIGAYQILSELGRGGMGAVYLAVRSDDSFRKQVALKLVKRGMDTDAVLERFRHERQILANLDHPYIARMLDGGSTDVGAPFFVMEYVDGEPVDRYCRKHELTIEERCRLFLLVCDGVAHAHRNLVVHRDIKPGNILITANGIPKLLDFGVAKLLNADPETALTRIAPRPLTPEYASPEHFRGLPATTATDVYSLGAVLYELLTGARAQVLPADRSHDWERIVCEKEVVHPRWVNARLPVDLENILLMALRKAPERRYSTVEQFAGDVQRFLEKLPVMARGDSWAYRSLRYAQRNRAIIAAALVVSASLVAGTIIATSQARRAEAALQSAEVARRTSEREEQRAQSEARTAVSAHQASEKQRERAESEARAALTEEQRAGQRLNQMVELANHALFDVHDAIERLPGALPVRQELIRNTLLSLETLAADAIHNDRLAVALGAAYLRVGDIRGFPNDPSYGDPAGALQSYGRARALLTPLIRRSTEALKTWLDLQYSEATVLSDSGQAGKAVELLTAGLRLANEVPWNESGVRRAKLRQGLTRAQQFIRPTEALHNGIGAIADFEKVLAAQPSNADAQYGLSTVQSLVAMIRKRRDEYDAAAIHLRESLRWRQTLVVRNPHNVRYQRGLMLSYGQMASLLEDPDNVRGQDFHEARVYYERAAVIARELHRIDTQSHVAQYDLASVELRLGSGPTASPDRAESLALLARARRGFEALAAADPQSVRYRRGLSMAHRYAGENLRDAGEMNRALAEFRSAVAASEKVLAVAPADETATRQLIGIEQAISSILAQMKDRSAIAIANQALARAQAYATPDRPQARSVVAQAHWARAQVHRHLGDWEEARSSASLAIAEWKELRSSQWAKNIVEADAFIEECASHVR